MTLPTVSVIVPVRESEGLERCLGGLERQTYPRDLVEVIVVDNGAVPGLRWMKAQFPDVKLARERSPGSYRARNTGLRAAGGEIIAFTDADCVPRQEWLDAAVRAIINGAPIVAGGVQVVPRNRVSVHPIEAYEMVNGFPQARYVKRSGWCATANMVTTRAVFDAVGPFRDELLSGGDAEWGKRATEVGLRPTFVEKAAVGHPARDSFRSYYDKLVRVRVGQFQQDMLAGSPPSRSHPRWADLKPPVGAWQRAQARDVLKDRRQKFAYVLAEVFIRYAAAFAILDAAHRARRTNPAV